MEMERLAVLRAELLLAWDYGPGPLQLGLRVP